MDAVLSGAVRWDIVHGDSAEVLKKLPAESVHSIVTDPPSGTGFMAKSWDRFKSKAHSERDGFIRFMITIMEEALRVLKPGGHALVWALPRASHWTAYALEEAGFEVRDSLHHVYGQGFPKNLDIAKAIEKAAGVKPIGERPPSLGMATGPNADQWNELKRQLIMPPLSMPEALQWDGWGNAMKPSHEVWWLCRKSLEGTTVDNVLKYGTGGINIDGARGKGDRWPPNFLMSHSVGCEPSKCLDGCPVAKIEAQGNGVSDYFQVFYTPKPSVTEKSTGCASLPKKTAEEMTGRKAGSAGLIMQHTDGSDKANPYAGTSGEPRANSHPTVKAVTIMRWLTRLVTPPNGVVLDPFAGSGSTGVAALEEGFRFIGIELDPDKQGFIEIARARCNHAAPQQINRSQMANDF